jgi:hypothetical protein
VGIPNEHFRSRPLYGLFGEVGLGWGADPGQLEWAGNNLEIGQRMYRAYANSFPQELKSCIEDSLAFFNKKGSWVDPIWDR